METFGDRKEVYWCGSRNMAGEAVCRDNQTCKNYTFVFTVYIEKTVVLTGVKWGVYSITVYYSFEGYCRAV